MHSLVRLQVRTSLSARTAASALIHDLESNASFAAAGGFVHNKESSASVAAGGFGQVELLADEVSAPGRQPPAPCSLSERACSSLFTLLPYLCCLITHCTPTLS